LPPEIFQASPIQNAFPEFDCCAAHSRQSKRASQVLPPACQNSFREARHHENWGLSNAIFWEKLFRRHLFNWTAPAGHSIWLRASTTALLSLVSNVSAGITSSRHDAVGDLIIGEIGNEEER
jgi:hypothetical protein